MSWSSTKREWQARPKMWKSHHKDQNLHVCAVACIVVRRAPLHIHLSTLIGRGVSQGSCVVLDPLDSLFKK